jgi:hypothetical protein
MLVNPTTSARWILAASWLLAVRGSLDGQEYELHGTMHQENTPLNAQPFTTNHAAFSVYVRGCAWLVRAEQELPGVPGKGIREVGTVDGRELFDIALRDPIPRGMGPLVSITSNAVPTSHGDLWASHLWLMLASHCFFEGRTNAEITPVFDISASMPRDTPLTMKAEWVLSPHAPHLPTSVVYRAPATQPPRTLTGQPGAAATPPAAMPLLTEAVYTVTGTAAVGDLTLPTGFTFERFRGGIRRVAFCTVTVTNLSPVCSRKTFVPSLPENTLVVDRRANGGQRVAAAGGSELGPGAEDTIPAGSINLINADLSQALQVYGLLADAELDILGLGRFPPVLISFRNEQTMTRSNAVQAMDKVFYDHGILVRHSDPKHVVLGPRP